jgi:WD40 repeat protein
MVFLPLKNILIKGGPIWTIDLCEDYLLSGSYDKTIKQWNFNGKCLCTIRGHTEWVSAIQINKTNTSTHHNF